MHHRFHNIEHQICDATATTRQRAVSLGATTVGIPSDWIAYTPGTCNVVISSPHGGSIRAAEIAERTNGCLEADGITCRWEKGCSPADGSKCRAATVTDSYTQEVAALVVQHLSQKHNCVPHFVRSNLHRSRLDPNREIGQGAQGDPLAEEAWRAYHDNYMASAVESVRSSFGKGLVFDIHGQSHSEQWTEIGYLLSRSSLNSGPTDLTSSSIRGLAGRSQLSAAELVSGPASFGAFLEASGNKAVPSPAHPSPGDGGYYNGGYITQRYGSRESGQVDSIQVELPNSIRFDKAKREKFAEDMAQAIKDFRVAHNY